MPLPRALRIALLLLACLVVAVGVVAVAFLVMLRVAAGPGPMARCAGHERFAAAAWRDSAQAYGPLAVRGCMVDDLRRTQRLQGRTRAEVVALLGEPRPTDYFREYHLVYWLGPERSALAGIDSEWLVLRLDDRGRVAEHRLVTD